MATESAMARKHGPLLKLNKQIAEDVFGHQRGRPTLSRRAGRHIGRALGVHEETGTDLFHGGLVVTALALLAKAGKPGP